VSFVVRRNGGKTKNRKEEKEVMKRRDILTVVILVFLTTVVLAGCTTMKISMNPKVPIEELTSKRIPIKVGLYMDTEFQGYHWKGTSGAEMSKLDYDLGSASKSLFLETFMRVSKSVVLVDRKPPYASQDGIDVTIVIEPHITKFSERHSAILRVADYSAQIEYKVIVYDRKGNVLLDRIYQADGVVRGRATHSPGSNYAAPAEIAMAKAIVMVVDDISKLKFPEE